MHLPTSSEQPGSRFHPLWILGGTSTVATFTISTWFRNLYPTGSWRTLTRGSTNGHHLIVSDVTNRVGVFANGNGDWRDSGEFDLEADGLWHQIVLVSNGSSSKFYLDGVYRGDSDRPTGDNIHTIGNYSGGGQRFAEYLDDFRVYGIALTDFEVETLYREAQGAPLDVGENSYSVSVWVKPATIRPIPEYDFAIGWYEGGGGEYMQAKLGQGAITDYDSLTLLNPGDGGQEPIFSGGVTERLFNGSFGDLNLDDIDFGLVDVPIPDIATLPNVMLWLDANDSSTIVTGSSNEINTWSNKIDPSVMMHSHSTNKPDSGALINGLNAIDFDKRSQDNIEYMDAKKNGTTNWNPAGENGVISGKIQNLVLFMVARLDEVRRSQFPFGFGWRDHFPWQNRNVFWRRSDVRETFALPTAGSSFVLTMTHSITEGKQKAFVNGELKFDKPRTNDWGLDNMSVFRFPNHNASGDMSSTGFGIDWTLGEMIVFRGTKTDQERQEVEVYLANKWGVVLNYGFAKRNDWVYQDTNFAIPIDFNGVNVNARSLTSGPGKTTTGIGTGGDNIGGVWLGKLRVANSGFLRAGNITFATRSDDGSVVWIDLDEDGDFSKSGLNGSELIVDNKGSHGQQNRIGTRFLGRKTPIFMRAGNITHKGISLGSEGYPFSWHATYDEEFDAISNFPMEVEKWHHLVTVVDREAGRMKQYLNGKLSAEKSFIPGRQGEVSLGDWFFGGMPSFNDRFDGMIDDARIYSVALSDEEVGKIYNNNGGDLGLVAEFTAPSITDDSNISVNVRFLRFEEPVLAENFTMSDLNVTGATISNFTSLDGNFSFNLIPDLNATEVSISLLQGAGEYGGDLTLPASTEILLVPPVPGKSEMVSWWWFDEGKDSKVTDSISNTIGTLAGETSWSLVSSYGTSLSFQNIGDYADLRVPAANWDNNKFSLSFWFRRNEEGFSWSSEQISNVMLSLGNEENCSIQLGTKGTGIELYLSTLGKTDRTSIPANVQNAQWHYLSVAYDATNPSVDELNIYMDGSLIGKTSIFGGQLAKGTTEKWLLGVAHLSNLTSGRFMGNIDDLRIYNKAVSLQEHQSIYNGGKGDLNLVVHSSYPTATDISPIVLDLNFTRYGMPRTVDFNQSLLSLSNAVFNEINASTGSSLQLEINATVTRGVIEVSLLEGLGTDASYTKSLPESFKIGFGRPVTKLENLVAWWTFDEGNGSTVTDYMGGYVGNFINNVDGNVTFDNTNSKFGYALRFPKNAWVATNAYPAAMGVGDGNPRTISFWMYAEQHESPNGSNRDYQTGIYGMGRRSNANGVHWMWGMRGLWDTANYRRIFSQHWGWDPQIYISEGVKNKWMHIAHQYTGSHVKAYVNGSLRNNWAKSNISTGNVFPLQFGRFTEETRTDRTFKGLLDDFRVYNTALSYEDISKLYNGGDGDFLVVPSFVLDEVVEKSPAQGSVIFNRNGIPINVLNFTESDLQITNGSIVSGTLENPSPGYYTFDFLISSDNENVSISLAENLVEDTYNQGNDSATGQTLKMYRAVTRGKDLVAWWPFDTDILGENNAVSKTGEEQVLTLFDAKVSSYGRFGKGVRFRKDQSDARIRVENNGINLGNNWTLTSWAKDLLPPNATGRSTLYQGGRQTIQS